MSYQPRPNATGDTLENSRDPIRTNFEVIRDRFADNHVNIDGGTDGGKHRFLQLPESGTGFDNTATPPTTAVNDMALFSQQNALTSASDLYFRRENDGDTILLTGILNGTVVLSVSPTFTTVAALPANSYGFVIFSKEPQSATPAIGSGTFFSNDTNLYSAANQTLIGVSILNILRLESPSTTDLLSLRAAVSSGNAGTYNYRIHYWTITETAP